MANEPPWEIPKISTGTPFVRRQGFMRWQVVWIPPRCNDEKIVSRHRFRFTANRNLFAIQELAFVTSLSIERQWAFGAPYVYVTPFWERS